MARSGDVQGAYGAFLQRWPWRGVRQLRAHAAGAHALRERHTHAEDTPFLGVYVYRIDIGYIQITTSYYIACNIDIVLIAYIYIV